MIKFSTLILVLIVAVVSSYGSYKVTYRLATAEANAGMKTLQNAGFVTPAYIDSTQPTYIGE